MRTRLKKVFVLTAILAVSQVGYSTLRTKWRDELPVSKTLYEKLQLASLGLQELAFEKALTGYLKLREMNLLTRPGIISIVDFSQSSNAKRLYVIDVDSAKVLYQTYVAHGRNSGEEFATAFGNKPSSYMSSLGFYLTGSAYQGQHGLSLRLNGCEEGINDRAVERGIVVHGAWYVSPEFIQQNGRLGRSQGCPAVSAELSGPIINAIKEGSCFFVYHPDSSYFCRSSLCR